MSIKSDLEYYMVKRPNEKVYLQEIEEAFNGLTKKQLQQGMYMLARAETGVSIITNGACWIYKPENDTNKISDFGFTIVGESKNGVVVLEDATGELWRATKI